MQVVIEIPETMVNDLLNLEDNCDGGTDIRPLELVIEAIKNGTPLPKGHGDLIDRNELKKVINQFECYDQVLEAPAIIKADKGE